MHVIGKYQTLGIFHEYLFYYISKKKCHSMIEYILSNKFAFASITLSLLIAMASIVLNTDFEKKGWKKRLNIGAWLLLIGAICSYFITLFVSINKYQTTKLSQAKAESERVIRELRYKNDSVEWLRATDRDKVNLLATEKNLEKLIQANRSIQKAKQEQILQLEQEVDLLENVALYSESIINPYFTLELRFHLCYSFINNKELLKWLKNKIGNKLQISIAFERKHKLWAKSILFMSPPEWAFWNAGIDGRIFFGDIDRSTYNSALYERYYRWPSEPWYYHHTGLLPHWQINLDSLKLRNEDHRVQFFNYTLADIVGSKLEVKIEADSIQNIGIDENNENGLVIDGCLVFWDINVRSENVGDISITNNWTGSKVIINRDNIQYSIGPIKLKDISSHIVEID